MTPGHPLRPFGQQSSPKTSTFSAFGAILASIWEPLGHLWPPFDTSFPNLDPLMQKNNTFLSFPEGVFKKDSKSDEIPTPQNPENRAPAWAGTQFSLFQRDPPKSPKWPPKSSLLAPQTDNYRVKGSPRDDFGSTLGAKRSSRFLNIFFDT